jgi:GNAT superfamily N-acetyltransferase
MTGQWQVRRVYDAEALEAIEILHEASVWTSTFGEPIWAFGSFTPEELHRIAVAGEQIGGFEGTQMVACMRLHESDPIFWADDPPGEALYLHKLAVRRSASGRGWSARLVQWAVEECRKKGARALRLDTLANDKLPRHYETLGFHLVDETSQRVGGVPIVRMQLWVGDARAPT